MEGADAPERRTVLVVGGTGILAPAVMTLRDRGARVIDVSRGSRPGLADRELIADARDAEALADALGGASGGALGDALQVERWDDALLYAPALSPESLGMVRRTTRGRCVVVRTTAHAAPAVLLAEAEKGGEDSDLAAPAVPRDVLQLGWRGAPGSAERWHTPEEISEAALLVLADGEPRTLGAVRPWSDRP